MMIAKQQVGSPFTYNSQKDDQLTGKQAYIYMNAEPGTLLDKNIMQHLSIESNRGQFMFSFIIPCETKGTKQLSGSFVLAIISNLRFLFSPTNCKLKPFLPNSWCGRVHIMLLNIDDLNIGDRQKFCVVTRILTYFIDFMHPNFSQAFT